MCIPFNSSWMYYFLLVLDITFKSYCIFLSTHLGYIFLLLHPGYIFLLLHPGYIFLLLHPGYIFLLTHPGYIFLLTHPGYIFFLTHPGYIFLLIHPGYIFFFVFFGFRYFPKGIFPRATSHLTISQVATSQMCYLPSGNFRKVRLGHLRLCRLQRGPSAAAGMG